MCISSRTPLAIILRLALINLWSILFIAYFSLFAKRLQKWDNQEPLQCYKTAGVAASSWSHPYADNIYIGITFFTTFAAVYLAILLALAPRISVVLSYSSISNSPSSGKLYQNLPRAGFQLLFFLFPSLDRMTSDGQRFLVQIALLQCPVHIWSIFALRASNNRKLDAGGGEQEWGFGQIVAMVFLGATVFPIIDNVTGKFISLSVMECLAKNLCWRTFS